MSRKRKAPASSPPSAASAAVSKPAAKAKEESGSDAKELVSLLKHTASVIVLPVVALCAAYFLCTRAFGFETTVGQIVSGAVAVVVCIVAQIGFLVRILSGGK